MAKIRIGFSTHFEVENELVGIGTDNPTNTKQVLGNIHATNAKAIGVSTLTTFDGFTDTKLSLEGSAGAKQHTTSGEIIIEGEVTVSSGTTYTSGPENLTVTDNFTLPGISDDKPSVGTTRFNENLAALEFYTGVEWRAVNYVGRSGRAVFAGGTNPAITKDVNYIQIPTQGNSISFGDLITASQGRGGLSDGKRGISVGGYDGGGITDMDYFTLASEGNGIDFGNLTASRWYCRGVSSSTRGVVSGGSNAQTTMDYVEIATKGDAVSFGTMPQNWNEGASCQSPTRGFFLKHSTNSGINTWTDTRTIYITIASKGAGTRWNELTTSAEQGHQAVSNNTRAVMSGGDSNDNAHVKYMEYWNMDSLGVTKYFGDLTVARGYAGQGSTQTRGVFYGGSTGTSPNYSNTIDYVTFATAGNAVDFGDIDVPTRATPSGMSDSHGGLGGF